MKCQGVLTVTCKLVTAVLWFVTHCQFAMAEAVSETSCQSACRHPAYKFSQYLRLNVNVLRRCHERRREFPASAVMRASFVCSVYRL